MRVSFGSTNLHHVHQCSESLACFRDQDSYRWTNKPAMCHSSLTWTHMKQHSRSTTRQCTRRCWPSPHHMKDLTTDIPAPRNAFTLSTPTVTNHLGTLGLKWTSRKLVIIFSQRQMIVNLLRLKFAMTTTMLESPNCGKNSTTAALILCRLHTNHIIFNLTKAKVLPLTIFSMMFCLPTSNMFALRKPCVITTRQQRCAWMMHFCL